MLPSLPKFCCPSLGSNPLELCTSGKGASPVLALMLIAQSLTLLPGGSGNSLSW